MLITLDWVLFWVYFPPSKVLYNVQIEFLRSHVETMKKKSGDPRHGHHLHKIKLMILRKQLQFLYPSDQNRVKHGTVNVSVFKYIKQLWGSTDLIELSSLAVTRCEVRAWVVTHETVPSWWARTPCSTLLSRSNILHCSSEPPVIAYFEPVVRVWNRIFWIVRKNLRIH